MKVFQKIKDNTQLRLKIVGKIHDVFPRLTCWASCVGWAYGNDLNVLKVFNSSGCKKESITHMNKMCYCGFWYKGKPYKATDIPKTESIDDLPF